MTPLRELRYDGVTLYPRPRSSPLHRGAGRRAPSFHLSEIFPPIRVADFLPRRKKRRNARRDEGGDAAAVAADYPRNRKPRLSTPEPGAPSLECCSWEESEEDEEEEEEEEDESEATARYVVGPDSIRFLPPVDQGSLAVFDRWREVRVPSPWPWGETYWLKKPEPWQRFYLGRGAGRGALTEKKTNQELWIAFLLDRGAGRHSPWWMELELAFASARASIDAASRPAKRRCLSPADDSPTAAPPPVHPLGQVRGSGATEEDRGRDGD